MTRKKKRNINNHLITVGFCLLVLFVSVLIARAGNDGKETHKVPVQDGIKVMVNDIIYVTENDSVTCVSTVNDGLISAFDNDFTFKGIHISRNHPNYGFFQDAAERYFNDALLRYLRTPKGKLASDKQKDINEFGVPKDRKLERKDNGEFDVTLIWNDHQSKYNSYGKKNSMIS